MDNMIDGKLIEEKRYDKRALDLLKQDPVVPSKHGSNSIPFALRSPYIYYEKKIRQLIRPCHKVLEIGSGTGLHTYSLLKTGAHITATDISSNALKVVEMNLQELRGGGELKTLLADMELLPFENQSFDVVDMGMYATVRDQTEKMKFDLVFFGSFESFL